jgi:alkanesulfonate monooxygenase SsuD/methylene tetrahydromethanopterin reductase-like flavin-dependent oxidoreductase (luciferase family)
VGAVCADSPQEAERLMMSIRLLRKRILQGDFRPIESPEAALRELGDAAHSWNLQQGEWPQYFYGTPDSVRRSLEEFARAFGMEEVVVVTTTHDYQARLRSYELLAREFELA